MTRMTSAKSELRAAPPQATFALKPRNRNGAPVTLIPRTSKPATESWLTKWTSWKMFGPMTEMRGSACRMGLVEADLDPATAQDWLKLGGESSDTAPQASGPSE